ncbi:MAG: hypothetical protein ACK56Q_16735, partial [Pirellulaceae bacterium]
LRFIWIDLFHGLEQRKDERIGFENLAAKVLLGCGSAHVAPLSGQWGGFSSIWPPVFCTGL